MDPKTTTILLSALLVATGLAGCSSAKGSSADLVVQSQPVEVHSVASTNTSAPPPANQPVNVDKPKSTGHIVGLVVDSAIRPIAGAHVRIASLDLTHPTDRDGAFAFTDLYPGAYYLAVNMTGFESAQTIVQVDGDAFVRVKFVLNPIPPPAPYHTTTKFEGFADVSDDLGSHLLFGSGFGCGGCQFPYTHDPLARTFILEATMDPYQWTGTIPSGGNSFDYELEDQNCCNSNVYGQGPNPLRAEITAERMPTGDLTIYISPAGFPLPETSKSFEVFVTAWFNSDPPPDWSIVGGDT